MPAVKLRELLRVLTSLRPTNTAWLVQGLLKLPAAKDQVLSLKDQITLAIADWLTYVCVGDRAMGAILQRFTGELTEWSGWLEKASGAGIEPPLLTLTISDNRYAYTNLTESFFDLDTQEDRKSLEEPAVTHFTCNLLALYRKVQRRLEALKVT